MEPSTSAPTPEHVQTTDDFYHVRVRPKSAFAGLRTDPESASAAAAVVGPGCDVREGRTGTDRWVTQSVLLPRRAATDGAEAEELTREVVERLEP